MVFLLENSGDFSISLLALVPTKQKIQNENFLVRLRLLFVYMYLSNRSFDLELLQFYCLNGNLVLPECRILNMEQSMSAVLVGAGRIHKLKI